MIVKIKKEKNSKKTYSQLSLLLYDKYKIMTYILTGKLIAKYDEIQRTATFKIREFAVEKTEDIGGKSISNFVKFQCVQDKTNIVDKFNIGDEIKISFNIKGSKWEKDGKVSYFTNLDAWRIEQASQEGSTNENYIDKPYSESIDTFSATAPDTIDDLPF